MNAPRSCTTPPANDIRFEKIYRTHLARVLAYARRRVSSAEAAEEVAAETFLVVWRRLDDVPAEPLPWLFGVARRVVSNRRRGVQRQAALFDALAQAAAADPGSLADTIAPAGLHDSGLIHALAELDEDDREALMLVAWEELNYRDAAAALGISEQAFSRRLSRARKRLRRQLERSGAGLAPSTDQREVPS